LSYLLGCGGDGAAPGPEGIERPLQEAAATLEGVVARSTSGTIVRPRAAAISSRKALGRRGDFVPDQCEALRNR
jgi:hypothetical protein